jgi:hypothetical protein
MCFADWARVHFRDVGHRCCATPVFQGYPQRQSEPFPRQQLVRGSLHQSSNGMFLSLVRFERLQIGQVILFVASEMSSMYANLMWTNVSNRSQWGFGLGRARRKFADVTSLRLWFGNTFSPPAAGRFRNPHAPFSSVPHQHSHVRSLSRCTNG